MSEAEFYQPEFFNKEKLKEFEAWYDQNKENVFDFKKEFNEYCESDVLLLAEGCLRFRAISMKQNKQIDPFRVSFTIASYCNLIYRENHMPENSIAHIPDTRIIDRNSTQCLLWLKWVAFKLGLYIRHAHNGREVKLANFKLDGYCEENKTFYEYHGKNYLK